MAKIPEPPRIIHSVGLLGSGRLVVNVEGSTQLLAGASVQQSSIGPDQGISHIFPLDNARAFGAFSRIRGNITLLDIETLRPRFTYGVTPNDLDPPFTLRIFCYSVDQHITIFNLKPQVSSVFPEWGNHMLQPVLLITLSPSGWELVTVVEGVSGGWEFRVMDMLEG